VRRAEVVEAAPEFTNGGSFAARLAMSVPVLLVLGGVALLLVGAPAPGAAMLVLGAIWLGANLRLGSPKALGDALGGRRVGEGDEPRLVNIVEGLCVANGLTVPELRVLADDAPNAIVLGRKPTRAVLFCTTGLLEVLDRIELEAVVAHELAHLKRGDLQIAARSTVAAGLLGALTPAAARFVVRLGGPEREALADGAAAMMTRYPPGLVGALRKLGAAPSTRPDGLSTRTARLTAALWCVPLDEAAPRRTVEGLLDLNLRVAALAER